MRTLILAMVFLTSSANAQPICGTFLTVPQCGETVEVTNLLIMDSGTGLRLLATCTDSDPPVVCTLRASVIAVMEHGKSYCLEGQRIDQAPGAPGLACSVGDFVLDSATKRQPGQ